MKPSVRENILPHPVCHICPWYLAGMVMKPVRGLAVKLRLAKTPKRHFYSIEEQRKFQVAHELRKSAIPRPFT